MKSFALKYNTLNTPWEYYTGTRTLNSQMM